MSGKSAMRPFAKLFWDTFSEILGPEGSEVLDIEAAGFDLSRNSHPTPRNISVHSLHGSAGLL